MAEYLIQGETLTGIADAIRGKTGGTAPVAVSDMAAQIEGIEAGGGDIDALIGRSLTEISSDVTVVGSYALAHYKNLTSVDFPVATAIYNNAFYQSTKLANVNFPALETIYSDGFGYCAGLTVADFPVLTNIGSSAFYYCSKLKTLALRSETVATLGAKNALNNTPIASGAGYIYVPSALIEQYKVATNWTYFAAQFRALEDYTVDGTVTGELDPAKTGT